MRFDVTEYYSICNFTILWELWFWDEEYCIWYSNYISHTLRNYESMVVVLKIWKLLIVFWWKLLQVLQLWMVITVLGVLGHGSIVMLQLLMHLLGRFWECQNGEERIQLCLKFSQIWCLSCITWSICSLQVLWQCTIHMIHEEHMFLYFKACHGPGSLLPVIQMVCD